MTARKHCPLCGGTGGWVIGLVASKQTKCSRCGGKGYVEYGEPIAEEHDHTAASLGFDKDVDYYEVPDEFGVFEWSPAAPGTANVKPAQVHLIFGGGKTRMIVRFKGTGSIDALIDSLTRHREGVWGPRRK